MKLLAGLIVVLMAFMQPAFAEKGKRGEHRDWRGKHMEQMVKDLQLNSEQEPQVRKILDEQHAKLRQEMEAMHEAMKPKMEALKTETSERLSTVLTPEQLQKFNSQMEKRHEKMRDGKKRWQEKDGADSE